jgi:hypothetical protein
MSTRTPFNGPASREEILTDEFTRSTPPGTRVFSVGILRLCRKLDLSIAMPDGATRTLTEEQSAREMITIAWLLDENHSLEEIKKFVELAAAVRAHVLDEYEFAVSPAFLMAVRFEVARTSAAVEQSSFRVEPKPSSESAGPSPPGNS